MDSTSINSIENESMPAQNEDASQIQHSALYGWKGFIGELSIQPFHSLSKYAVCRVAAGGGHTLFLTTEGQVFGRGHNAHGQLGLGQEFFGAAQAEPKLISALAERHIVAIAAGRSHSAAICSEGQAFCWGDSSDGQCGTGSLETVLTPTKVKVVIQEGFCEHGVPRPEIPVAIENIACGGTHTLALSTDDELWAWGCGEQLGLDELLHAPVPRRIEALVGRRVLMVACGESHSLALLQKVERTTHSHTSPNRHRNVHKENVVTQKFYPSLCAKCNKEIYTYTDTNDTCIIDEVHECHVDDSFNSFESSMTALDKELVNSSSHPVAPTPLANSSFSSDVTVIQNKPILPPELGISNSDERHKGQNSSNAIIDSNEREQAKQASEISQTDGKDFCMGDSSEVYPEKGSGGITCTGEEELNKNNAKQTGQRTPEVKPATGTFDTWTGPQAAIVTHNTDDVFFENSSQDQNKTIRSSHSSTPPIVEKDPGHENSELLENFAETEKLSQASAFESDGEVWKRQSASDIKYINAEHENYHFEEKVTSMNESSSPIIGNLSRSRTPSSGSAISLPKSKSLFNENQAREYLARQLSDLSPTSSEEIIPETKTQMQSPPDTQPQAQSSWKNFLPYSSTMMETVKVMTSKALSNIQNTMDSLVGQQNMELGEANGSTNLLSGDSTIMPGVLSTSAPLLAPNAMTDSSGSLEFGIESMQESLSETRPSSLSPPRLPEVATMVEDSAVVRQSLRTVEMKQQNLDKRNSSSSSLPKESDGDREAPVNDVIFDTEVWAWGNNQKGQLGLGDSFNRAMPVCIKVLNNKCVLQIGAGSNHSLALTANSQVYAWGANSYSQLGHSEQGFSPARIKFMKGCSVWDMAAGISHSIFLADGVGMKPTVFYCGKQPGKDVYTSVQKAPVPTSVNDLKKLGWIRSVHAGGDNCYCLLDMTASPALSAVYELASSERAFYQEMVKINTTLLRPLSKCSFFTTMDVFPYKSTLHNIVTEFINLTKKIGEGIADLTYVVRENKRLTTANFFRFSSQFVDHFRRYSCLFGDFLAVGGFEYCTRNGSEFFDKHQSLTQSSEDKQDKGEKALSHFRSSMQYPFFRLKEYSRLLQKIADSFPVNSDASNLLQKAVLNWDSLKLTVTAEHKLAGNTRAFWEGANPRLADALRIPSRRVLRDSKSHPLMMAMAGRFSSHIFILFNDMFVHLQSNTHTIFSLETLWVEAPVTDSDQNQMIVVISPEDRLELCASSAAEKAEWLMALNSAINKILSSQREVGRRRSAERLTPPLVRHAAHTFVRHPLWKDGIYIGTWLSGKLHGQGEMKWTDGRKYTGFFKNGQQHGHGVYVLPKGGRNMEIQDGNWKDGKLSGYAHIKYANGDVYKGYFKAGQRFGHGVLQQGRHLSSPASTYVGEWLNDRCHGYGVQDDILKGEKYMGMWVEDHRHGNGIMVTLDGMYFEGNFYIDKLTGFGLMLTDDNSCYEGEFMDITQLSGKGTLTLPTGDQLEGTFNGSWNEGLKINGTFIKCAYNDMTRKSHLSLGITSKYYGRLSVPADQKWEDIFRHCLSMLGHDGERQTNPLKAWELVAVAVSSGRKQLKEMQKTSAAKAKIQAVGLEELETIPHQGGTTLSVESFAAIAQYLRKAFDTTFHPLGQLMENLVDVFLAAYVGIGAHPRLLHHAIQEVSSYIRRIYQVVRILFPELPADGGPLRVYPQNYKQPAIPTTTEDVNEFLKQQDQEENIGEVVTAAGLLYPILLPKIYPSLFDLYALYTDRDDERYWERVTKLNRQGDMALMAFLGIDQKFWMMDDILQEDKNQKLSSTRDVCYASAVDALQQISTAFSPIDKLMVIEKTFNEITQTVQSLLGDDHMWCMDDLFPIFQYVVVRAKIQHLGAEINMIDDLMERHMEHGELGIMFTTLKASYFQIQNEKIPHP